MTVKVLHIIEAFGKQADGIAGIVSLLAERLAEELEITIVAVSIDGDFSQAKFNIYQIYLPPGKVTLGVASRTAKEFQKIIEKIQPDIIHIHGVFSPLQRITIRVARKKGIPTILSPHGMLEPWLWDQKGKVYKVLKRGFWRFIIYPTLAKTNYVHAITENESKTLSTEFPHHHQIQIPNSIDLRAIKCLQTKVEPERSFVFLGRIHPIKGVDLLIRAFKHAQLNVGWHLVIAGPDFSPTYGQKLRQLAVDIGLEDRVHFIGPVYGEIKYVLLRQAWTVVVPSYSEVVALVNLESAAVNTPTITTTGTGLHDWEESSGLLIDADVDQLSQALRNAASWSLDERQKRGAQARTFIQEHYSWNVIGPKWVSAYQNFIFKPDK